MEESKEDATENISLSEDSNPQTDLAGVAEHIMETNHVSKGEAEKMAAPIVEEQQTAVNEKKQKAAQAKQEAVKKADEARKAEDERRREVEEQRRREEENRKTTRMVIKRPRYSYMLPCCLEPWNWQRATKACG